MSDDYEREFMPGKGEVLHRSKVAIPRWAFGLMGGISLGLGGATAAVLLTMTSAPLLAALSPLLGGVALAALQGGLLLTFGVGRIAVSEGEFHVQIGTAGPRIPMEEIESFEIGESGTRRVGLGYRKLLDGTEIYSMMGDNRRAVRIRRAGKDAPLVLVCREPEAVIEALSKAKARASAKVRVAADEAGEEELEHVEEAERERALRRRS